MTRDHRAHVRRQPESVESLSHVRLRAGRELTVVDVCDGGLLVEGPVRLRPGTHVEVHVITREGRALVRGRITRASVVALSRDSVTYRAALAFERLVDTAAHRVVATHNGAQSDLTGQHLLADVHNGATHSTT
jgi:hypothetical protein